MESLGSENQVLEVEAIEEEKYITYSNILIDYFASKGGFDSLILFQITSSKFSGKLSRVSAIKLIMNALLFISSIFGFFV